MRQRKNIAVYALPKKGKVQVTREHALRDSVFLRARILALTFVMLLALGCVAGTLAFFAYTGNQTPNRFTSTDGLLQVVENLNGSKDEVVNTNSTFDLGLENKRVKLRARSAADDAPDGIYVRASFMPQASDKDDLTINHMFGETWSSTPETDEMGTYIETDLIKLYINPDYADFWTYSDGTFTSKTTLAVGEETPVLLYGAIAQDDVDTDAYSGITVTVIASSIEAGGISNW